MIFLASSNGEVTEISRGFDGRLGVGINTRDAFRTTTTGIPHSTTPLSLNLHVDKIKHHKSMTNMDWLHRVAPKKRNSRFLRTLLWSTVILFTLLDRASFPHYNNTKIIKFGWELFILWVILYGLSFSGFAINMSLFVPRNSGNRANPENDSP